MRAVIKECDKLPQSNDSEFLLFIELWLLSTFYVSVTELENNSKK